MLTLIAILVVGFCAATAGLAIAGIIIENCNRN